MRVGAHPPAIRTGKINIWKERAAMERLTARHENGKREAYYPYCFREDTCDGDGTSEKCDRCDFAQRVCEAMASYEETGLTPEQIREIDKMYIEKCEEVAMLQKKIIGNARSYLFIDDMLVASNVVAETHYANNRWIPIEKQTPDEGQEVWVSTKTNAVCRAMYTARYGPTGKDGFLRLDGLMQFDVVVAWQPYFVPDPYRPERNREDVKAREEG